MSFVPAFSPVKQIEGTVSNHEMENIWQPHSISISFLMKDKVMILYQLAFHHIASSRGMIPTFFRWLHVGHVYATWPVFSPTKSLTKKREGMVIYPWDNIQKLNLYWRENEIWQNCWICHSHLHIFLKILWLQSYKEMTFLFNILYVQ